jgi:hypothetical protein
MMAFAAEPTAIEVRPRSDRMRAAPPRSSAPAEWTTYYEQVYRTAAGDAAAVPWANGRACGAMVAWLNAEGPGVLRPGAAVAVVGCGLGDDVQELSERGFDVVGFDCSPTAVAWARRRHTAVADRLMVADLFDLPSGLLRRHDLVVEVNTLQSLEPAMRQRAAAGVASLARPRGAVLAICRGREDGGVLPDAPPYPLTAAELESLFAQQGMAPTRALDCFYDNEDPEVLRLRGLFRRV